MQESSATESTAAAGAAGDARDERPLGCKFAEGLGHKDFDAVNALLDPRIDFRGLTPGRVWEATDARTVIDGILRQWFEDSDELDEIIAIDADSIADRQRVSYRFQGHNAAGPFVVEQQAYYTESDAKIDYMRVLCSGFRPL
jgi:hypothetical protein